MVTSVLLSLNKSSDFQFSPLCEVLILIYLLWPGTIPVKQKPTIYCCFTSTPEAAIVRFILALIYYTLILSPTLFVDKPVMNNDFNSHHLIKYSKEKKNISLSPAYCSQVHKLNPKDKMLELTGEEVRRRNGHICGQVEWDCGRNTDVIR